MWTVKMGRRTLMAWALAGAAPGAGAASTWLAWDSFARRFVQDDGRVVDITFDAKSTSEGQSYALFFALVANQRARFDQVLRWTSDNLAAGQLGTRLPAWHWGRHEDGRWAVKDENAASDADLWIAYTLFEAARLWNEPSYARTARLLLAQVQRQEVVNAGAAGPLLLPSPVGFVLDRRRWRFNPSYVPGFMFRQLSTHDPQGPWAAIWSGFLALAPQLFAAGVAPDNVVIDADARVAPDSERAPSASYDGIRVYLWAGMSGVGSHALVRRLAPFAALVRRLGAPPEKVNPSTGAPLPGEYSPLGFAGAVLPFLDALGDRATLAQQDTRVRAEAQRAARGVPTHYYDQALILFGSGWLGGTYRFDEQGRVRPRWAA